MVPLELYLTPSFVSCSLVLRFRLVFFNWTSESSKFRVESFPGKVLPNSISFETASSLFSFFTGDSLSESMPLDRFFALSLEPRESSNPASAGLIGETNGLISSILLSLQNALNNFSKSLSECFTAPDRSSDFGFSLSRFFSCA